MESTTMVQQALPCSWCRNFDQSQTGKGCLASMNSTDVSMACDKWSINPQYEAVEGSAQLLHIKATRDAARQAQTPLQTPAMPAGLETPALPPVAGAPVNLSDGGVNVTADLAAQLTTPTSVLGGAQPAFPPTVPGMPPVAAPTADPALTLGGGMPSMPTDQSGTVPGIPTADPNILTAAPAEQPAPEKKPRGRKPKGAVAPVTTESSAACAQSAPTEVAKQESEGCDGDAPELSDALAMLIAAAKLVNKALGHMQNELHEDWNNVLNTTELMDEESLAKRMHRLLNVTKLSQHITEVVNLFVV